MSQPKGASILLIEKDDVTLDIYQRELSKSFTVFAFLKINGILETLASQNIQAVIIEPEISGGQGWQLIDAIRDAFPERCIPVVVCSTRDGGQWSRDREITRYLIKPVLPNHLRLILLDVLGK